MNSWLTSAPRIIAYHAVGFLLFAALLWWLNGREDGFGSIVIPLALMAVAFSWATWLTIRRLNRRQQEQVGQSSRN